MNRVRTPTRIQMEAAECGAVALAIVLEHYGQLASVESLRVVMGVSRDGVSAGQIARAARARGLTAQGVKAELDDLDKLPVPAILHWEFDHFVVYEGRVGEAYFINDPAVGPRRLSRGEMDAAFTGVAIALGVGPQFERTPPRPGIGGQAWERLRPVRSLLGLALLVSLGGVLPGMLVPTFSGIFTDSIVIEDHRHWLWTLLATMAVVALVRAWTGWARGNLLTRAQTVVAAGGALTYMRHALTLPVTFFHHRFASEIAGRLQLVDAVSGTLTQTIAGAGLGLVCMALYSIVMFCYDAQLTILAMLFAGISLASLYWSERLLADGHRRVLVEEGRLSALINRGLASVEESAAAGSNELVYRRVMGQKSRVLTLRQHVQRNAGLLQALQRCLATLGLVAVLMDGGRDVMDGVITVGMMVSYQGLMYMFAEPIATLVQAGVALQDVSGNLERLDDVLKHPPDPVFTRAGADQAAAAVQQPAQDQQGGAQAPGRGRIEFRGVSFGYSSERPPQIRGLDLVVEAGTSVAVVGATGCGKSTLARLLVGQLVPTAGDILVDGRPLREMSRSERFGAIANVDQEVRLFTGSVLDNLRMWDDSLPMARVRDAVRAAGIEEMIEQRPGGYMAPVTEAGANMSGGERQRLDIARALACDAAVLLMDEATSGLDPLVERKVLENVLASVRAGHRTLVFISHRLAPLALFDRIVVLQDGIVQQDGGFDELMVADGPLRQLVDA